MFIIKSPVTEKRILKENIYLVKVHCPEIALIIKPGQFLNIRVSEKSYPLLRRPFSVCDVENEELMLMFNVAGEGTRILASKSVGEYLDILGPLGNGFKLDGNYETAVIVAGGLGSAPFPFLTRKLIDEKKLLSFVGGKSNKDIITYGMRNVLTSSDDGSEGFKGTVIDLLASNRAEFKSQKVKMFGCGPSQMLKALQRFCNEYNFECEISTECAMACGFGICQGCPIESSKQDDKYLLVCKDGPVFNIRDVVL